MDRDFGIDVDQVLVERSEFVPAVVRIGTESMRMEVKVTDPSLEQIEVLDRFLCPFSMGAQLPAGQEGFVLRDDGLNGDEQAGDLIFTQTPFLLVPDDPGTVAMWDVGSTAENWNDAREHQVRLTFTDGTQRETRLHLDAPCGVLADTVPIPQIKDLSEDVRATRHVLSVAMPPETERSTYPYYFQAEPKRYGLFDMVERVTAWTEGEFDWVLFQDFTGQANTYFPINRPWSGVSAAPLSSSGLPSWLL
ncbi:MAG: hypothetical protein AAGH19_10455, partial [Pseudomonadota bacterium]